MEIALVHDNSLILGPMGLNVRMINGELEDLELEDRVSPQSFRDLPIHFSDGLTHLVPINKDIPSYDSKYHNIGDFTWEIIKENDVPVNVTLTYNVADKTIEEVKELRKKEVSPIRKQKENTSTTVFVNGNTIEVSTSREERLMLTLKLSSLSGTCNYKFKNTWASVNSKDLKQVVNQIDTVVQQAYDWELSKLNEIDACQTLDDVYNVVLIEDKVTERKQRNERAKNNRKMNNGGPSLEPNIELNLDSNNN
jgi:hypothetical protein